MDIQFLVDEIPFVMDRHSAVFVFKVLCISFEQNDGFVVVDRFL
ncbi:hypothetical protein [Bacillus sp. FJAT-29937]|nr:hypothetical protein [Bacillus sp. FJAT-29937]